MITIKSILVYRTTGGSTVDSTSWLTVGTFDASGGSLPTVGGSGSGGAFEKDNILDVVVAGIIDGVVLVPGTSIRARQDNPTSDWDVLTGWKYF